MRRAPCASQSPEEEHFINHMLWRTFCACLAFPFACFENEQKIKPVTADCVLATMPLFSLRPRPFICDPFLN